MKYFQDVFMRCCLNGLSQVLHFGLSVASLAIAGNEVTKQSITTIYEHSNKVPHTRCRHTMAPDHQQDPKTSDQLGARQCEGEGLFINKKEHSIGYSFTIFSKRLINRMAYPQTDSGMAHSPCFRHLLYLDLG